MIRTNKLIVGIDYDAIASDFDIYSVTKDSSKLDQTNVLDIPVNEFKALAVQYTFGRQAFVLFKKDSLNESAFRDRLNGEFSDVKVYHITLNDLKDEEFRGKNFYGQDRLLVQLLFNSLMNIKVDSMMYNNLTGKLFYSNDDMVVKDKKNGGASFMSFLEVKLDPGMFLNLDVKTFKQDSYAKQGRQYVIDDNTGRLRKELKTDGANLKVYTEGSFKTKHKTVDFLDISSYAKFQKSKLGVMQRFLNDVERSLGRYITIGFSEVEEGLTYEISKKEKKGLTEKDIGAFLNKRGVVIVDENQTEKSFEIAERMKYELAHYYGVIPVEGDLSKDKYNIRIIHTPEYYEENELPDLHQNVPNGFIVQHLMEEAEHFNDKESASPAVHKIVQELIIKGDVVDEQISIFDWNGLDSDKQWTFVTRKKINIYGEKNEKHLNAASKETYDHFTYKVLNIGTDGKLEFSSFDDKTDELTELQNKICFAFDDYCSRYQRYANVVEGLVFSDETNMHAIILTPEKTLPNIVAIANGLRETDSGKYVLREEIIDGIDAFREYSALSGEDASVLESFQEWLEQGFDKVTLAEVRKKLGMGKKISKCFNRFMHENYNIWFSAEMKDQTFEDLFMLDNLLDIKYYQQPDYEDTPSFYYYVGTKRGSLQGSIHNACAVRKVVSQTGNLEFSEMLPLMAVDFVRNKQYTVMPFPFKYLREWKGAADC